MKRRIAPRKHNQEDLLPQGKTLVQSGEDSSASAVPEKFEAVVFDFDGTLAVLNIDFADMKRRIGEIATEFLGEAPISDAPVLEWLETLIEGVRGSNGDRSGIFRSRAEALILEIEIEAALRGGLFSFARSVLEELRSRGVRTAIITRNCERAVRLVFPDIDEYCACFLSREHVSRVKPDPIHLLQAIERASASPGATLMVGDHPLDMETGRRARVTAAGVASGRASEADLLRSGARWTAANCEDLLKLLAERGLI